MQKSVNYVVVANAQEAKIFEKIGNKVFELNLILELAAELDSNHEKRTTSFNSIGNVGHGIEPHTDRRDVEKQKFAKKISESLEKIINQNQHEGVILIASHKMMNFLENSFSKHLQNKIAHKLSKDIAEFKNHEIKEYLEKNLAA